VKAKKYWFSLDPLPEGVDGAYVEDGNFVMRDGGVAEIIMPVADMKLGGDHNVGNALAAIVVAKVAKEEVANEDIVLTLKEFEGLSGRQSLVREIKGISFVNDTTATSPDGTIAALDRFHKGKEKDIVLLAGGSSKGASFDTLVNRMKDTCKMVILFPGEGSEEILSLLGDIPHKEIKTMKEALNIAAKVATAGDTVLLSPATASFGSFKNEFDRGGQFVDGVKALKEKDIKGESTVTA